MQDKQTQNIFFFFGNDNFSMHEVVRGEKKLMLEGNKNADINDFDFADGTSRFELEVKTREALRANSLFSSDKLTVIRDFWSGKRKSKKDTEEEDEGAQKSRKDNLEDFLLEYISKISPNDKIFFLESKSLDKRGRAYKFFEGLKKDAHFEKKEFALPLGYQFNIWLEDRVKKCGGKISKSNVDFLAMLLGKGMEQKEHGSLIVAYDLYQAASELDKLIAYCDDREITKEDSLLLVSGRDDMNIFSLIESLGRRDKNRALAILTGQLRQGSNGNYILTMLVFHFRNLISIKSLLSEGLSADEISKQTNIHPYVVEKNTAYARSFKEENLVFIYEKLYAADLSIKTGKMEPELALDLLIAVI
ncbi:MAG: DNA polymerase III subunit delta [Candidatus Pacebacteria bacterium]|jgi:DNA polymerase-3 subunit delta|nr:DNA polymerase III subunit delta [Candidatus Paceibacterota bacterium]